jgi:hypothetical protein
MMRWILLPLLGCALLLGVGALQRRTPMDREQALTIERLLAAEELAGRNVAAISIQAPDRGLSFLHVRSQGRWRLREAFGAPSDQAAIEAFLRELLDAHALALPTTRVPEAEYGFSGPGFLRITLHGPKVLDSPQGDPLASVELSAPLNGRVFARRGKRACVLDLDRDLGARLGPLSDTGLPPLVDAHFVAASLPVGALGLTSMTIERADQPPLAIQQQPPAAGASEPGWNMLQDGTQRECLAWRAGGYMALLLRGQGRSFASPARAAELGLAPPYAKLTLSAESGKPVELLVSELQPGGRAWLWNKSTNVVLEIDAELQRMLAPEAADFVDERRPNPWERFLESRAPKTGR